jgi:hypothetical protein
MHYSLTLPTPYYFLFPSFRGFAYKADGAHADEPELEPGVSVPEDAPCTQTLSCPAPMYHIDGLYLGQYSNLPEERRTRKLQTKANNNNNRKDRVTRTRRVGAKAGEAPATEAPATASKGTNLDVDDDYWYHYTSEKKSKKGMKSKKEDSPSTIWSKGGGPTTDDMEEPEVEEPGVEEPPPDMGHGGGGNGTASEDFGLDFYEPLFFHPIGEWVGAEFSIKLVREKNCLERQLSSPITTLTTIPYLFCIAILYRILTMKAIPKTFSTFATFISTCRDASSCSRMAFRSIQITRPTWVTCTTNQVNLMPSAAALAWTTTNSRQLYGECVVSHVAQKLYTMADKSVGDGAVPDRDISFCLFLPSLFAFAFQPCSPEKFVCGTENVSTELQAFSECIDAVNW